MPREVVLFTEIPENAFPCATGNFREIQTKMLRVFNNVIVSEHPH